jgi:hypothetical protein
MAARIRIRCVTRTDRPDPHERISHIGGALGDHRWRQSHEQTIREIENGDYQYYVEQEGQSLEVIVAVHNGKKYIKTTTDGENQDQLLRLPECPQ